ncbi:MAG: hypothetical protein ACXVJU_07780 [Candidatus Angelobacter sp.]
MAGKPVGHFFFLVASLHTAIDHLDLSNLLRLSRALNQSKSLVLSSGLEHRDRIKAARRVFDLALNLPAEKSLQEKP